MAALILLAITACAPTQQRTETSQTTAASHGSADVTKPAASETATQTGENAVSGQEIVSGDTDGINDGNTTQSTAKGETAQGSRSSGNNSTKAQAAVTTKKDATTKTAATVGVKSYQAFVGFDWNKQYGTEYWDYKIETTPAGKTYALFEYEGKNYGVETGRNGSPFLIKDYTAMPEVLKPYCYPTFDTKAISMDVYRYAKTKGFKTFSLPGPKFFTSQDQDNGCSWGSPAIIGYDGDSTYTGTDHGKPEFFAPIASRFGYQVTVNRLARTDEFLMLWFKPLSASSNLYNGKRVERYERYFITGTGSQCDEIDVTEQI